MNVGDDSPDPADRGLDIGFIPCLQKYSYFVGLISLAF